MKVRIAHDSIRVRLNQSEVRALGQGELVQMETVVSDSARIISVVRPASVDAPRVSLKGSSLSIDVPRSQLSDWAAGDSVSIESRQAVGGDRGLTLLIEKDFHCLHRDNPDDVDTFPNPKRC